MYTHRKVKLLWMRFYYCILHIGRCQCVHWLILSVPYSCALFCVRLCVCVRACVFVGAFFALAQTVFIILFYCSITVETRLKCQTIYKYTVPFHFMCVHVCISNLTLRVHMMQIATKSHTEKVQNQRRKV